MQLKKDVPSIAMTPAIDLVAARCQCVNGIQLTFLPYVHITYKRFRTALPVNRVHRIGLCARGPDCAPGREGMASIPSSPANPITLHDHGPVFLISPGFGCPSVVHISSY